MTQQEFSMKLHIKPVVLGTLLSLLVLTLFTACSNTALFASIEKEVKLNDPTVRGIVTSLEVVKGTIYIANGNLYQRAGGDGTWNMMPFPSDDTKRCSEVASDGTNLYARFTTSDQAVTQSIQMYNPSSKDWTIVTGVDGVVLIGSGNKRIYAFTGTENSYKAYATTGVGSTVINAAEIAKDITTPTGTSGNYISTNTKVYSYDGTTFTDLGAPSSGITGITTNGTNVYAVNSGSVYRYNETTATWSSIGHSISTPTTNISYLGAGGKNLLLIGSGCTSGGFGEVVLAADGSLQSTIDTPGDSDASSIVSGVSTQYSTSIDLWAIHRIFAVSSAVPAGNDYALYASVINSTYDGLWSYYSGTQNEWNRE